MKQGKSLQELAVELKRQRTAKKDYLVDTRKLRMTVRERALELDITEENTHTAGNSFEINTIAHRQIGAHLGIPAKYYDKMLNNDPELLTHNVNTWFGNEPTTRMLRTLDGNARAFLSDRYRRIDNYEIAQAVLPIIHEMPDAIIDSCELTESKMYLKVLNPRVEAEVTKGDIVQAGFVITNSETGQGAVSVMPLIFRLVCLNGLIVSDAGQRKYHIGRINEVGDEHSIYRDETIEADDRAFLLKVQDTVRTVSEQTRFESLVETMREATEVKITSDIPTVVELASKEFNFNKNENDGVLDYLIRGGDFTLYGLSGAVTKYSQDVESYDRATELETVGWDILTMDKSTWDRINAA